MLGKRPQHRRFSYTPRFGTGDRKERIKFQRKTYYRPRTGKNPLFYLILLIAFFLIYLYLKGGILPFKPKPVPLTEEDAVSIQTEPRSP